jgi:hypothetical protein
MDILTITFLVGSVLVLALGLYISYQDKQGRKQQR